MARPPGSKTVYFGTVQKARAALAEKAQELLDLQTEIAKQALAAANFAEANKAVQFLLEHMPKDDDGITLLDPSVDSKGQNNKSTQLPTINIGFALGGVRQPKELPAVEVIDVTEDTNEPSS